MAILTDNFLFLAWKRLARNAREVPAQAENSRDDGLWLAEKDQGRTTHLGIYTS
jgi:hypothetical protein